jgi:hypothetical protein
MSGLFIFLLTSNLARAQNRLFFPIEKSHIRSLPQQFEYQIIDADHFRVGDLMIDSNKIDFRLSLSTEKELMALFRWPSALVSAGEIVLQDNVGKSLWKKNISSANARFNKRKADFNGNQKVRLDEGLIQIKDFPREIVRTLHNYPFFRFCIHQTDEKTQIYLCSKDLYFSNKKQPLLISSRNSLKIEPLVEINGRIVGPRGIVFLQKPTEILSMHALLSSGTSLDIDTRMGPVDLRDVFETKDHRVVIEASGAEPAEDERIVSRKDGSWKTELQRDIPAIYLKGEGGIPMRQEFSIDGAIRPESLQIEVLAPKELSTYSSEQKIILRAPAGTRVAPYEKESSVTPLSQDRWAWTVTNLKLDDKSRRFLRITTDEKQPEGFIGGLDIYRSRRNQLVANLGFYPLAGQLQYIHWVDATWGYDLHYFGFIQKNGTESGFQSVGANVQYRLTPSLVTQEPSSSLSAGVDDLIIDSGSFPALAAGASFKLSAPNFLKQYFDHAFLNVRLPFLSLSSSYATGFSFNSQYMLQKRFTQWDMGMGVGYTNYAITSSGTESDFRRILVLFEIGNIF